MAATLFTIVGETLNPSELPLPGGADLGEDPYAVTVQFSDVLDLVPQSAVKVNDVTVGKVDRVDLDGYTAEVTVLLREDVELPDNAVAHIRQTSLLGEKFVSLSPPDSGASSGRLGEGDVIPLDRSGRNPEVEEVLGGRTPTFEDVAALGFTTMVVKEATRLYPPVYGIARLAQEGDVVLGYGIPPGATVVVSPWATHRHPGFWDEPEQFDPERFAVLIQSCVSLRDNLKEKVKTAGGNVHFREESASFEPAGT